MTTDASSFLVIDVGLTHVKAAVINEIGRGLAQASVGYPTHRQGGHAAEQDPEDWWSAAKAAVASIGASGCISLSTITAVAVTGHMHALVCADDEGRPVRPAIVLGDSRGASAAEAIVTDLGQQQIHDVTGARLDRSMPAAKIAWLRRSEPDVWSQTRRVRGTKDQIRSRMTGDHLTDPVDSTATSLYDIKAQRWSGLMLEAAGVDESQLPEIRRPDSIAGELLPGPAAELGLNPGIPVVVGAGDDVEVVGRGALEPGQAVEILGTTGSIMTVAAKVVSDPALALESYPHILPGLWVIGGSMTAAGSAIAWAADTLGYRDVAQARGCLANGRSGTDGPIFLPHLAGSRVPDWDPMARGAWLGMTMSFDRNDLMYAVFEGVALGLRAVLDRITEVVGPQRWIYASCPTGAEAWVDLRCSAYRHPLVVSDVDATALGSAILAAVGVGVHADIASAVTAMVGNEHRRVEPHPPRADVLDDRNRRFLTFVRAMQPAWAGFPARGASIVRE